jgi:radical SAM protein with 4Fe4S-binding SPASM domain
MKLFRSRQSLNPGVVIWEMTRACALACRHCRAEAGPHYDPEELTYPEAVEFLQQVSRANPGVLIMTGGDPMMRVDLLYLIRRATELGLRVALSPSATPRLLRADFFELKAAGVARMSLSIDGATRESHDRFRGVPGTWDRTMEAFEKARVAGIPVQINTTLNAATVAEWDKFPDLIRALHPAAWTVFTVVPTGRADGDKLPAAHEVERIFNRLHQIRKMLPCEIKTTEGMHYRRVSLQRENGPHFDPRGLPEGTGDGRGVVFVSHRGEICPSGFLPIVAGNVREDELLDVYRDHKLFRDLRNPAKLQGKCGRCSFNRVCGGSRARAYAVTRNVYAEDPLCVYQPQSEELLAA